MHQLTTITLATVASLLLVSGAASETTRERILRDAHSQRCPTDAPCRQCFWPVSGDTKFIMQCSAEGAPEGAACRCKSLEGWQEGEVLTSYPDQPINPAYR